MTIKSLLRAWNDFFFAEQSPVPIALFRIFYGVMVVATLVLLEPDWLNWYGPHAWLSLSTMHVLEPGPRLNLFTLIPQTNFWINLFFWVFLLSATLLAIGLLTRLNSVLVFVCIESMHQRNLYINHGGDTFLRLAGFFLMFAPAGAALSIDRLIRIWRGKEVAIVRPRAPWAQRMIQYELAMMYLATFCWKIQGAPWIQGTALYYVYHLDELRRFPLPSFFLRPLSLKVAGWAVLALEFCLGVLIWVKELRYYILAAGLLFHLILEYSVNIPLFQWDILTAYILFVDPADLARVWNRVCVRMAPHLGEPVTVIYDARSPRLRTRANLLAAIDIFRRVTLVDERNMGDGADADVGARGIALSPRSRKGLLVATPTGVYEGSEAVPVLAAAIPLLRPFAMTVALRKLLPLGI